jgi:hypothetical protein
MITLKGQFIAINNPKIACILRKTKESIEDFMRLFLNHNTSAQHKLPSLFINLTIVNILVSFNDMRLISYSCLINIARFKSGISNYFHILHVLYHNIFSDFLILIPELLKSILVVYRISLILNRDLYWLITFLFFFTLILNLFI